MPSDLSAVPTGELRDELYERDRIAAEAARDQVRERLGTCQVEPLGGQLCGADFVSWQRVVTRPILLCGLFGHQPGHYGDEFELVVTCAAGHETRSPDVHFFDRPMPL